MVVSNWLLNQRGETESWSSRNCLRLPEQAGDEVDELVTKSRQLEAATNRRN